MYLKIAKVRLRETRHLRKGKLEILNFNRYYSRLKFIIFRLIKIRVKEKVKAFKTIKIRVKKNIRPS
jgi:hypothetical protein